MFYGVVLVCEAGLQTGATSTMDRHPARRTSYLGADSDSNGCEPPTACPQSACLQAAAASKGGSLDDSTNSAVGSCNDQTRGLAASG